MDISVKNFDLELQVKTNGIEFLVRDNDGTHRGTFVINKARIEWCKGKKRRGNGVQVDWDVLIDVLENRKKHRF